MDHNGFLCIGIAVCFNHGVVNLKLSSNCDQAPLPLSAASLICPLPCFLQLSVGAETHWKCAVDAPAARVPG